MNLTLHTLPFSKNKCFSNREVKGSCNNIHQFSKGVKLGNWIFSYSENQYSHVNINLSRSLGSHLRPKAVSEGLKSSNELFMEELEKIALMDDEEKELEELDKLRSQVSALRSEISRIQMQVDKLYSASFDGLVIETEVETESESGTATGTTSKTETTTGIDERAFRELGQTRPKAFKALLGAKEKQDPASWRRFQAEVSALKLQRTRAEGQVAELEGLLVKAERDKISRGSDQGAARSTPVASTTGNVVVVLITGFESFNVGLYERAAGVLANMGMGIELLVFSDRDINSPKQAALEAALARADIFFGSLLFDFDQVEWLKQRIGRIPIRLVFESALELMSSTQIGSFTMSQPAGKSSGPPPVVKKVLSMFGSGREEDKMVGYLSFLKIGPKLLRFIPGKKAADLRTWLTVYGYWNQGGLDNVVSMFTYLVGTYFKPQSAVPAPPPPKETPATGVLHPLYPEGYFASPAEYMQWYSRNGPLRGTNAPVVAILLYRKHVVTSQDYIPTLINQLESEGLLPIPVFINGVEAHTIVRDMLTSKTEQALAKEGKVTNPTLKKDAVLVDAIVSTIGFPLVGGPAGTMEGGRQADIAKSILTSMNVPYIVAAPLLIQDISSWSRDGIAGLQSVVLYSLPELDGAIDTVPLGGLMGNEIFLVPERVRRLAGRLRKWVELRRKPAAERRVAVLMYGFPPGVGATGTAALLNVPKSLEALLVRLAREGYDLGEASRSWSCLEEGIGEQVVTALKQLEDQRVISRGAAGVASVRSSHTAQGPVTSLVGAEVSAAGLKDMLTYPTEWGPTEWGPIPFLPDSDILVQRMEAQWGDLRSYRGIMTTSKHTFLVPGLQLGNVWVGVQPLLGIEGDPMRLLFDRDLTPHPQYAATYKWLQEEYKADVILHFGMHGTVEWLPGAPLGNTGLSWSDVLLGDMPHVYIYAANNPSESIIAKRRGYGTIVSHNVPPYGRAGLYKQLASLKEVLQEYREDPANNANLKVSIVDGVELAGLQEDCPFDPSGKVRLTAETVGDVNDADFEEYASRLYAYLQVLEGRLFSEGLHVLGSSPSPAQMSQYLNAYFGDTLPDEAVEQVVQADLTRGVDAARKELEAAWSGTRGAGEQPSISTSTLSEALSIRSLLNRNSEELDSLISALGGGYVAAEAGGDLLRDGPGVLPTGRNIHALDPYRMPSASAMERGSAAAAAVLEQHRAANDGRWPETVAVNLWGLDAIKTKGESVGMALHLIGAVPVKEGTGRIARFELIPLEQLGRPRVDVLLNMSGIFRDSFQNVVELLDDVLQRAAKLEEPDDKNFIAKHARSLAAQGVSNPAARLFSNPAGDYGSMVNERVGAGNWENGDELGDTWASRNAFSYGRGTERGAPRPEVLATLLATTERVVQQVDSVEYGLTDIQEYYANTGALVRAAEKAKGAEGEGKVGCSIVEAFSKEIRPRDLKEVLRLEYRSKLLNPRWAQAMAAQGSGGAFEISSRMTAMVGWGATTRFTEDWTWDQAADTYALDPEMAQTLRKSNPQAFSNILKRMIEAHGRGMWTPSDDVLKKLRTLYAEMDEELEGVK